MFPKAFAALFALAFLAGCLTGDEPAPDSQAPVVVPIGIRKENRIRDSVALGEKFDSLKTGATRVDFFPKTDTAPVNHLSRINLRDGGWDDFPNVIYKPDSGLTAKYREKLVELADMAPRLPVPMGLRYGQAPRARIASASECQGPVRILTLLDSANGVLIRDTITYAGAQGCGQGASVESETHRRYILDLRSGEAWERLVVVYSWNGGMRRCAVRGTGSVRLVGGLSLAIADYDLEMDEPEKSDGVDIRKADMVLTMAGGYSVEMGLMMPMDSTDRDLFPYWQDQPEGGTILQGRIRHGGIRIGYIDLKADKSVILHDRAKSEVRRSR